MLDTITVEEQRFRWSLGSAIRPSTEPTTRPRRFLTWRRPMTSLRRMTIPDLVADPALLERLIGEGETLFVERKESDPRDGLGPTIASFANMLGGWLLIGVDDDGQVVGYSPPGRADLQDHVRQLLGPQVDPLPPFAAITVEHDGLKIGVVRAAESSDTPHITSDGVIFRRTPGGKERVTEARDSLEMARRGEQARFRAEVERLYRRPLIEAAMRTPDRIFGDEPGREAEYPPLLEWIVRATPYTVTGAFADRALSRSAADLAEAQVSSMFPPVPQEVPPVPEYPVNVVVEPRARGVYCAGSRMMTLAHADVAIDAGGVVAVRIASRRNRGVLDLPSLPAPVLVPLIRAGTTMLADLDGYGRAAVGLEVRGARELNVAAGSRTIGVLAEPMILEGARLEIGGDIAVPAVEDDIRELADRWMREIARAAGLPMWEPEPEAPQPEAAE